MTIRYRLGATSLTLAAQNQWSNEQGDADSTVLPIEPDPSGAQLSSYSANDQRIWQLGSVGLIPNLLLSTLAAIVVASTDVPRGPLYQQQKVPIAVTAIQPPNLLTSTLSVNVPAAPFLPLQQAGLQRSLWQPADTTQETPKTLTADAQMPVGESPAWAPIALSRTVTDTSQKQPITLQAIVIPAPIVNQVQLGPLKFWWQPPDTTQDTPKTLTADAQMPVGGSPAWAPIALGRTVTDTSHGQPITLQVIVPPAPIVNAIQFGPVKFWWQPSDTSASTAKSLYADAQMPVGDSPAWAPIALVRTVTDTSQSVPEALLPQPAAALPIGQASFVGLQKSWWQPADTSRGTAKELTADSQLPIQNYQHTSPDRIRPVTDTSRSSYGTVYPVVVTPIPPGKAVYTMAPIYKWQVAITTTNSPPLAAAAFVERAYTFTGFTFIAG